MVPVVTIDPSQPFEKLEAEDRRRLVIEHTRRSLVAFSAVVLVVGVGEWWTRPTHRDALLLVGGLYTLILACHAAVVQARPRWAVTSAILVINALCAAMLSYSPMVQGSGELCVLAMNVLLGGFAVAFPLGLRNQLLASVVPIVGYPIVLLLGTRTAYPLWYSATALVSFLFVLGFGARIFDSYRRQILLDAFQQAALAAENARLRDEACAADRAKSDLMSMLSHEIRGPLANILGFSEVLLENELTSENEQKEFLQRIRDQSQRIHELVEAMLQIDRSNFGALPLQLEDLDITDLLDRVRSELPADWMRPNVLISWQAPLRGEAMLTDRIKLEAIARNLVHNALKHTIEGSVSVTAAVDQKAQVMSLTVTDSGEGMSEPDIARVFDRFFQATSTRSGFGLGLYIVKRFVDALGGKVRIESTPGSGTRFEVVLPLNSGDRAAIGTLVAGEATDAAHYARPA